MDRDIRDLYHDLMFYEVIPKSPEIEQAFKDLQPWAPMQPEQEAYYAQRPGEMLYRDIAIELKKKLDQTGQTQPPAGGYTEADRATATETNTIVKQIWGKISSVFK